MQQIFDADKSLAQSWKHTQMFASGEDAFDIIRE
jgi:hypothetical protein